VKMIPVFMIQRLSEISKSAIQQLKTIRFNHLSYYINDKKCVSELMSSEFQEYSDKILYANAYLGPTIIGTLKIDNLKQNIGLSGLYIAKDFRDLTISTKNKSGKCKFHLFTSVFKAVESQDYMNLNPDLVKISTAENAPQHILDMYKSWGFKYTGDSYTLGDLTLYNAEMKYSQFKKYIYSCLFP